MNTYRSGTGSLQPKELEAVYEISRRVAEAEDTEAALDEIVRIIRPVFIFDNMVLYICCQDNETLEPSFARAIGRGRFREADMAWGETTAKLTYRDQRVITQAEQFVGADVDRTNLRYSQDRLCTGEANLRRAGIYPLWALIYLPEHIHSGVRRRACGTVAPAPPAC
jgi:hypothetical protein